MIKTDLDVVRKKIGTLAEPTLQIILFSEVEKDKRFVLAKTDTLVELGFRVDISCLPTGKS